MRAVQQHTSIASESESASRESAWTTSTLGSVASSIAFFDDGLRTNALTIMFGKAERGVPGRTEVPAEESAFTTAAPS